MSHKQWLLSHKQWLLVLLLSGLALYIPPLGNPGSSLGVALFYLSRFIHYASTLIFLDSLLFLYLTVKGIDGESKLREIFLLNLVVVIFLFIRELPSMS